MKHLYSNIYCQTSSDEEGLLIVGNSEGDLIAYDLQVLASKKKTIDVGGEKLQESFSIHNDFGPIYSLTKTPFFCLSGSNGIISGRRWSDLKKNQQKSTFDLSLECDPSTGSEGAPEVNAMAFDSNKDILFAASGDCKTRSFDLETGKVTLKLEGHEDYVHDVAISENTIVTCGEDGNVFSWDPRVGSEPQLKLKPHDEEKLARPKCGKFVSSIDIESDLLVCGGGSQAGIFDLRTMELKDPLPPSDYTINVTKFSKNYDIDTEDVLIAGLMSQVYVCGINGEIKSEIQCSSSCIYSVNLSKKPTLLTFGGMSSKVDVCKNLDNRDYSFFTALNT